MTTAEKITAYTEMARHSMFGDTRAYWCHRVIQESRQARRDNNDRAEMHAARDESLREIRALEGHATVARIWRLHRPAGSHADPYARAEVTA